MAEGSAFERLTAYWRRLQEESGGEVPARRGFNPARVVQALPHIYLLKQTDQATIEVRLCGTAIDDLSGVPITGKNYLDVCLPEERDYYRLVIHQSLATPCAMKLIQDVTYASGRNLTLVTLAYPLSDEDGIPRFLVGVTVPVQELRSNELRNGPIVRSLSKRLEYIDIGFGVPAHAET